MKKLILTICALSLCLCASAQFWGGPQRDPSAPFSLEHDSWNAKWISVPDAGANDYGIYYFRKDLSLGSVPAKYEVLVTGDNRYKLYVNEALVSLGPAKGDVTHWNYEKVDLAPYLKAGDNVVAALVFNEGPQKTDSYVSVSTGFLLQGIDEAKLFYTDKTWKCIQDPAYSPVRVSVPGYYVAGPSEKVDMAQTVKGWNTAAVSTADWKDAREGQSGMPRDYAGQGASTHLLQPSILPQMEMTYEPFPCEVAMTIPANTTKEVLLDMKHLTNAYFTVKMSGGKGSSVKVGYCESLYEPAPQREGGDWPMPAGMPRMTRTGGKGDRNATEGKIFVGREDEILPDGTAGQSFTTLTWRTYRYVRLNVTTGDEPLTINDVYGTFTGYPFDLKASVDTDNQEIKDILEVGWRTARLCAFETYMDCPYYEQLQYLGDTRIQALITLYNTGDDRLVKNFFNLADMSRDIDGVTLSRYPTTIRQYIQPYALSYIFSLHDYLMYGSDMAYLMEKLNGAEQIMLYFQKHTGDDGRIRYLPGWTFSDWVYDHPGWGNGSAKTGADGSSIMMDLQLLYGYILMAEMESYRGNTYHAGEYTKAAEKLKESIVASYWDEGKGLFADRIEKDNFSQHANAMAILCDVVKGDEATTIARKILEDKSLAQCTVYFKFYLHQALVKAGLGDEYMDWLDIWRENLALGLTTWAETSDVATSRSDCHAWGSSPNIEFYRTVLGIDSAAPAFAKVKIEPHLGEITEIGGRMPHPSGMIEVSYKVKKGSVKASVTLPAGVEGTFVWAGKEYPLKGGANTINTK